MQTLNCNNVSIPDQLVSLLVELSLSPTVIKQSELIRNIIHNDITKHIKISPIRKEGFEELLKFFISNNESLFRAAF